MNLEQWLKQATDKLDKSGIGSARLDALILLEDETGKDRAWLLAHPEFSLGTEQTGRLGKKLARRAGHEPLAYIRGHTEFYGRRFKVDKHVLEPQPESETMIDLLLKLPLPAAPVIADIGTGSGALGITARLEIPSAEVDLYDIDAAALAVARHNCELHELYLKTYKRDLLSRPAREYQVILANLPYVPDSWHINEAAAMEPKVAIAGGKDGLELYRRMFKQLARLENQPHFILSEALPPQHEGLVHLATAAGYKLAGAQDFIQIFTR